MMNKLCLNCGETTETDEETEICPLCNEPALLSPDDM